MSLVKLVRGRQFQLQNVFRTISFGYMPFLPMSQSYKMQLDGDVPKVLAGASPAGYWNLGPEEEYKKNPDEGSYPWMIRRFAYNQGGSGRLSPLNSYNRQEMALENTPDNFMKAESKIMGEELQRLLKDANAIGERQYEAHDVAELEMEILGEVAGAPIDAGQNPLVQRPNQYRETMGITDDTFKQLSSQTFDFSFDKHPGVKRLTMGVLGEAGGPGAMQKAKGVTALEMTAGKPSNKFLVTNLKDTFRDIADAQLATQTSVKVQVDKINKMIEETMMGSPMVGGASATELPGAPELSYQPLVQQLFHEHPGGKNEMTLSLGELKAGTAGWSATIGPEDVQSTHHYLYAEIERKGSTALHKEARRIVSRAADSVNKQMMKESTPGMIKEAKWIEHLNLGGREGDPKGRGYQGLAIMETFVKIVELKNGVILRIPQLQALGVYVTNSKSLAHAARAWARKSIFAKVKNINVIFKKLHQKAADEAVRTDTRIDLAGTVLTVEGIEKMLGGVELYVGDAGGYPGAIGLTTTSMAEGLEVQLRRAFLSGEFQQKFSKFYSKMMDGSNRLSTQWKRSVPQGTTSSARISEEWTFGDGRQASPPGGPRKHFLGMWGPTGNAAGKYINWRDTQRRVGGNISISPFLTSRRAGVGQKELFAQ